MPYILKEDRKKFEAALLILNNEIRTAGDLNYVMTRLAHGFLTKDRTCYDRLNTVVGVFSCALSEFKRRILYLYEDQKIEENGDV